jgi:hypothetical protein
MRFGMVWAVVIKEVRDLLANRLLLGAVVFPALVFASIPTGIVAFIRSTSSIPTSSIRSRATSGCSRTCRRSSPRRASSS